mmetsp:Transcript_2779/g.5712  ORF Transcript_2779/g.5712 Transcript_2779/m.5712 type:complete len:293 (+) Transcript_2779:289-1167(+)
MSLPMDNSSLRFMRFAIPAHIACCLKMLAASLCFLWCAASLWSLSSASSSSIRRLSASANSSSTVCCPSPTMLPISSNLPPPTFLLRAVLFLHVFFFFFPNVLAAFSVTFSDDPIVSTPPPFPSLCFFCSLSFFISSAMFPLGLLKRARMGLSEKAFFFGGNGLDLTTLYLKNMLPLDFGLGGLLVSEKLSPPENKVFPSVKLPKEEMSILPSFLTILDDAISFVPTFGESAIGVEPEGPTGVPNGVVAMSLFEAASLAFFVEAFPVLLPDLERLLDALPIQTGSTKSSPFE